MALRDKIRERVTPHLPEGEEYKVGFVAQSGPSPYWSLVSTLIVLFGAKYRVVVATDRGLHVFKMSTWKSGQPKELLYSLPAGEQLSIPDAKLWAKVSTGSEDLWVHRRFFDDVSLVNQASIAASN